MDRLTCMEVFAKIVSSGSFAAAARHFRLSPAAASKYVRVLEDRLGARLLNRSTRRISPTEVGSFFYEHCKHILGELEEVERQAASMQSDLRGLLRVNAPSGFGTQHLAPAVADYLACFPEVTIDLSLGDETIGLIEGGFDIAIRVGALENASVIARRLAAVRMVLCAAPDYVERCGEPSVPADLRHHQCLEHSRRAPMGEWRFTGPAGVEVARIAGRLSANSGEVLRLAALRGEGIILAPAFIVGEDLRAGRLVPLLPRHEPERIAVYAIYAHRHQLSAKIRSFVDFLVTRFGRRSDWDRWDGAAPEPSGLLIGARGRDGVPALRAASGNPVIGASKPVDHAAAVAALGTGDD